jgi:putative oxidoreductase
MSLLTPASAPWPERTLALFRIVAALVFISTGTMKVFNFPVGPYPMPPFDPLSMIGIAGLLEVVGGAAILVGLLTRPVAFILAGEMAFAYFLGHASQSFYPTINNGTPAILYCFLFLYLSVAGPGAWSVDGKLTAKRYG